MLRAGVGISDLYDREGRLDAGWMGGEVGDGDGWFGEGYPGEFEGCDPFIAARCDEDKTARSAAFAGSSACSIRDRSWVVGK